MAVTRKELMEGFRLVTELRKCHEKTFRALGEAMRLLEEGKNEELEQKKPEIFRLAAEQEELHKRISRLTGETYAPRRLH